MIWPILSITQYLLLSGIALFVICSDHEDGRKAFYDLRHILVALFWPAVIVSAGIWKAGKYIFKTKETYAQQESETDKKPSL